MWCFGRLVSRGVFRLWLLSLGALLLFGLALVSLAQPSLAGAAPNAALVTPTATHTGTTTATTSTPRASATSATGQTGKSQGQPVLPLLEEGLEVLFLVLLVFGLVIVPIAVRSARIERQNRTKFSPPPVVEEEQVARLSQIAPERKEPLTREQLRALREAARGSADAPPQPTASLAAVHLVDGVPVTLPAAEPEARPQLPAPRRPIGPPRVEGSAEETASEHQG